MALRVLMVLAFLVALYGCGQSSPPPQESEKEGGVEPKTAKPTGAGQQETTQQATGNIAFDGVIGESIETPQFDYRTLDTFITDNYYYIEDPYLDMYTDAYSQVGKYIVISYSATNTSSETSNMNLGAKLSVGAGEKDEVYEESETVAHPYTGAVWGEGVDLAPREMIVGQFIFDVPADVEPDALMVHYRDTIGEPGGILGNVDLTEEAPQEPRPEEVLALQYEYVNMIAYEQAYELFAQETKDKLPEQVYESVDREYGEQYGATAKTEYSFPSIEVQGDRATIETVAYLSTPKETWQDKDTDEMVLEESGWRVVMSQDQLELFLNGGEITSSSVSASGSGSASP
jgi:hypothetical protein